MATTPPPRSSPIHTPPTPLHGAKYDDWEPYGPRRSARVSSQRQASGRNLSGNSFSPPLSIHASPKKRDRKGVHILLQADSEEVIRDNTVSDDGEDSMPNEKPGLRTTATIPASTMLPTPAKTPRKRPEKSAHALRATARVLFPARPETADEAMPSPRKTRKYQPFSLDSSMSGTSTNGGDNGIEIFTDSKERVPEVDASEDNPFLVSPNQSAQESNGRGKRRRAVERNQEIEEVVRRDDGMFYTFRGKKIFRKFEEDVQMSVDEDNDLASNGVQARTSPPPRPFTRSSLQPRLLFPTEEQKHHREQPHEQNADLAIDDTDGEAMTDIDENLLNPPSENPTGDSDPMTHKAEPFDLRKSAAPMSPITPTSQGRPLTPTSPAALSSTRTTRSSTRRAAAMADGSPSGPEHDFQAPQGHDGGRKKTGPFAGWRRTKSAVGSSVTGKKRGGEAMEKADGGSGKKTKA